MRIVGVDDYSGANGNLDGRWQTLPYNTQSNPQIVSGTVQNGTPGSNAHAAYIGAGIIHPDQWFSVQLEQIQNSNYGGGYLRANLSTDNNYAFFAGDLGASCLLTIAKRVSGGYSPLNTATVSVSANDTLTAWVLGQGANTSLSLFINAGLQVSATDAAGSHASGYPATLEGFGVVTATDVRLKNFRCGDFMDVRDMFPVNNLAPMLAR